MSGHGLTEEELAILTDEERAGLEAGDDDTDDEQHPDDENQPEQQKKPGDAGDDGEGGEDDPEGKPAGDDKPEGKAKPVEQPAAQQQEEQQPEQTKAAQPVPLFKADVPADIEAKFKDIDAREEALAEKFEDGDLTTREYNAQLRQLNKERGDLEWAQRKAELTQESSQSQREQVWYDTVNAFLPDHPLISKNETLWNSFNAVLTRVTGEVQQAGGWPGQAELEKAYKQWAADLGIDADAAAGDKPTEQKQAGKQPAARQVQKPNVPPTLANVPAAAHEDTDDGKYAHLDRLADSDPEAYETALSKLSPGEWDEYANSR